jgi:trimethylamine:corrinoid methyltransferase-like protein
VGSDGDFLALDHTRSDYREEWYPESFNRKNFDSWAANGRLDLRDRAHQKVETLLIDHQPDPLPKDISEAIQAVINRTIESKL